MTSALPCVMGYGLTMCMRVCLLSDRRNKPPAGEEALPAAKRVRQDDKPAEKVCPCMLVIFHCTVTDHALYPASRLPSTSLAGQLYPRRRPTRVAA